MAVIVSVLVLSQACPLVVSIHNPTSQVPPPQLISPLWVLDRPGCAVYWVTQNQKRPGRVVWKELREPPSWLSIPKHIGLQRKSMMLKQMYQNQFKVCQSPMHICITLSNN